MTSPFKKFAAQVCFPDGLGRLERGECPACGVRDPAATIKDALSRKEYHISGLCQECQDGIWKK